MSLNVPTALLERAETGPVDDAEFVACVRDSRQYHEGSSAASATWATTTSPTCDRPLIRCRAGPGRP
ncbi:hypothetical protein [Dactylosporangium sp. CA-233914]|uniref:hypothetical protein n=1 Tax=Dactylosporangium sp. CA-233914 TaxID=3239934 RepID=UPI003D900D39